MSQAGGGREEISRVHCSKKGIYGNVFKKACRSWVGGLSSGGTKTLGVFSILFWIKKGMEKAGDEERN